MSVYRPYDPIDTHSDGAYPVYGLYSDTVIDAGFPYDVRSEISTGPIITRELLSFEYFERLGEIFTMVLGSTRILLISPSIGSQSCWYLPLHPTMCRPVSVPDPIREYSPPKFASL